MSKCTSTRALTTASSIRQGPKRITRKRLSCHGSVLSASSASIFHRRRLMGKLSDSEINSALAKLEGWQGDGAGIKRSYKFKDFVESMGFVNKVALIAEKA